MGSRSNGRARLGVQTFDGEAVRERLFEESFYPKKGKRSIDGGSGGRLQTPTSCADKRPQGRLRSPRQRRRSLQPLPPDGRVRCIDRGFAHVEAKAKQLPQTTPTVKELVDF